MWSETTCTHASTSDGSVSNASRPTARGSRTAGPRFACGGGYDVHIRLAFAGCDSCFREIREIGLRRQTWPTPYPQRRMSVNVALSGWFLLFRSEEHTSELQSLMR